MSDFWIYIQSSMPFDDSVTGLFKDFNRQCPSHVMVSEEVAGLDGEKNGDSKAALKVDALSLEPVTNLIGQLLGIATAEITFNTTKEDFTESIHLKCPIRVKGRTLPEMLEEVKRIAGK